MTLIGRAWFAATLLLAIGISDLHWPDWRFAVSGALAGLSSWAFPER